MGACVSKNSNDPLFEKGKVCLYRAEFYINKEWSIRVYSSANTFKRMNYNEFEHNFNIKE